MNLKLEKIIKYIVGIFFIPCIIMFCLFAAKVHIVYWLISITFFICSLLTYILIIKKNISSIINFMQKHLYKILLILCVIGILVRISLFFYNYKSPISDYEAFFSNSVVLAENIDVDSNYIALFPHLAGYIITVGFIMKLFGTSYTTVIAINIILDILSSIIIYLIIKNITNNKHKASFGATIWLINPINIFWCIKSAPIVMFSFAFLFAIFILYKTVDSINKKTFLLWSLLLGIALGIANLYRPVIGIFFIAILIMYFFKSLKEKKYFKLLFGFIVSFTLFFSIGKVEYLIVKNVIKKEPSSTLPGYNLYVGSSIPTKGQWNLDMSNELDKKYEELEFDPNETQDYFAKKSFEQYKENGFKNITFFIKKFYSLTYNVTGLSHDAFLEQAPNPKSNIQKIIGFYAHFVFYQILFLNIIFGYKSICKKGIDLKSMILQLFIIGFFIASIIPEVASRYTLPLLPVLTILAVIWSSKEKNHNSI